MKDIPPKIYLQVFTDGEQVESFKELHEVSWCADKINSDDIEYVLSSELLQYQKCPKCDGQGTVSRPPWIAGDVNEWASSTTVNHTCNVCNGAKIIATPVSELTALRELSAKQGEENEKLLKLLEETFKNGLDDPYWLATTEDVQAYKVRQWEQFKKVYSINH